MKLKSVLPVVATMALTVACDNGGPTPVTVPDIVTEVPEEWSPAAVARLQNLGRELAAARDGFCTNLGVTSPSDYRLSLTTQQRAVQIPLTLGSCSIETLGDLGQGELENIEIVVFEGPSERDAFIEERVDIICTLAKDTDLGLPALRFAIGDDWSIQTDTQTSAIDVADVLRGAYRLEPCGPVEQPDWDPASMLVLQGLAEDLTQAGVGCTFAIADKDIVRLERHYAEIGLPGALASCDADFGEAGISTLGFVAYSDDTTGRDEFLPAEFETLCSGGADVRIVAGDGWDLFTVGPGATAKAAAATGGKPSDDRCEVRAEVSEAPSSTAPLQGPALPEGDQ